MQKQPELVGGGLRAGGPIGSQVRLPRLDVVLRLTAPAIHVLIEHARASGRQARDDEAGVCPLGPSLNPGDDVLDPAPARGAVVELRVTAHLACLRGGGVARHRARLQRLDMPAQGRGRGDAEDEVDPVGATPVEDLRAAIVAVSAQQDLRRRPVGADGPEQPAQEGADFCAFGSLGGPQHGGDEPPLPSNTTMGWNPYSSWWALNSRS